jgi:hypothetical protein
VVERTDRTRFFVSVDGDSHKEIYFALVFNEEVIRMENDWFKAGNVEAFRAIPGWEE